MWCVPVIDGRSALRANHWRICYNNICCSNTCKVSNDWLELACHGRCGHVNNDAFLADHSVDNQ